MASIEKYEVKTGRTARERTRYRVRYRNPAGRQTDKKGFKTKDEAERFAANLSVAMDRGDYVAPSKGRVTVSSMSSTYLAKKRAMLKVSSFQILEAAWINHVEPVWGTVALNRITPASVELWIAQLSAGQTATERGPLGASTVIRCHEVLAGILDLAVKEKRLASNPARGVELPRKLPKRKIYLTHQQVRAIAAASGHYEALVLTLAYTGMRWGEAAGLLVSAIDFKRRRIMIDRNVVQLGGRFVETTPKNGRARSVPFPPFLTPYLRLAVANKLPTASVFTQPDGKTLRRPTSGGSWLEAAQKATDAPYFTPHDLRHSAASFAISAGANVKAVQRMLGHSSAAMTLDTYADLFEDDLDTVAEALDRVARAAWA